MELTGIGPGDRYTKVLAPTGTQKARELPISPQYSVEAVTPTTQRLEETSDVLQRWNNPRINMWRVISCCVVYFGNGINDSATGALIPYMETHYHKGHAIMSLVFISQALGFVVAAFFNNIILLKIGRARMIMTAEAIIIVGCILLVCTPPYPVVVIAFFFLGYGAAMTLALNNVYCANLYPPSAILGAAHGSYGMGGVVAPIIATSMVSKGIVWSRFYFMPLVLACFAMAFAGRTFWNYEETNTQAIPSNVGNTTSGTSPVEKLTNIEDLKRALKSRITIIGALFIFAYQGAEVAISGWVISFLINYRDGDPASVGYVTAGFWGGITIGRFFITHLAPRVGERLFVVILIFGTTSLQLLAWLVPNVITNAVAVSVLGLLLGPLYPCAQTVFSRLTPHQIQTTSMGFISSAGSSGGAVAPFTTGILAQAVGTYVLHPVCISLYACMLVCWFGLPKARKRTE